MLYEVITPMATQCAGVAELADAQDLKSWAPQGAYGFDSRYMVKSNKAIAIDLYSGVDTFIWNINDIHFKDDHMDKDQNSVFIQSRTKYSNIPVAVGLMEDRSFDRNNFV